MGNAVLRAFDDEDANKVKEPALVTDLPDPAHCPEFYRAPWAPLRVRCIDANDKLLVDLHSAPGFRAGKWLNRLNDEWPGLVVEIDYLSPEPCRHLARVYSRPEGRYIGKYVVHDV